MVFHKKIGRKNFRFAILFFVMSLALAMVLQSLSERRVLKSEAAIGVNNTSPWGSFFSRSRSNRSYSSTRVNSGSSTGITADSQKGGVATASRVAAAGDFVADKVFGQLDFTQTTPNQTVGNRAFHPQGVLVDRSISPNRLYIVDSGNSRILGFSALGKCANNQNRCTNNLDCPGSSCSIDENREADVVIGQTDKYHGTCNGDNTERRPASASSLCLQPYPMAISLMETPETMSLSVDNSHNLYVFDKYNNRVLKFNDPISNNLVADQVWGQADFAAREANRGGAISNKGLNLSTVSSGNNLGGGIDVDPQGNVWVTDIANHRVLRFPPNSSEANLVIGQSDFSSGLGSGCSSGKGVNPPTNSLCRPKAVRYNSTTNQLFVIDWPNGEALFRVLIFNGPNFTNGMAAAEVLSGDWDDATKSNKYYPFYFRRITALEMDPFSPQDTFWLSNSKLDKIQQFKKVSGSWQIVRTVSKGLYHPEGTGIDSDGNFFFSDLGQQDIKRFTRTGIVDNQFDKRIIKSQGSPNFISGAGFRDPIQSLLVNYSNGQNQMFVSDRSRVLFWNDYGQKGSGSTADGVLFERDMSTVTGNRENIAITKDSSNRIWMAGTEGKIYVFNGPVQSQASPFATIDISRYGAGLPLKTGGRIKVRGWIVGIAYDGANGNDALWISDAMNHRILRINHPLSSPVVDMVIGQPNNDSYLANRGVDNDDDQSNPNWHYCPNMVADGFGTLGGLYFDNFQNLYVVDGSREGWQCSNNRLLEFDRETLIPDPNKVFFAQGERVPKRVYGGSDFTHKNDYKSSGSIPYTPIGVAFSRDNKMVMVTDGYGNDYQKRSYLFDNPLPACSQPCRVDASRVIPIPGSQLSSPSFDKDGNLVVLDHTWNRVLFFNTPISSVAISTNTPPPPTRVPTVTPITPPPKTTNTPIALPTRSPTDTPIPLPTVIVTPDLTPWSQITMNGMVPNVSPPFDAYTTFVDYSGSFWQTLMKGTVGYSRAVASKNDGSGNPDWNNITIPWFANDVGSVFTSGTGPVSTASTFKESNGHLWQIFFRGNSKHYRVVPPKADGSPDWSNTGVRWIVETLSLPVGGGPYDSYATYVDRRGNLLEIVTKGTKGYTRWVLADASGHPTIAKPWVDINAEPGRFLNGISLPIDGYDMVLVGNQVIQNVIKGNTSYFRFLTESQFIPPTN
ncbi:MAG: hypothetical protein WC841_03050 [Candidatus Shapirobacteria bacterium]|jgi:hypothetical protein